MIKVCFVADGKDSENVLDALLDLSIIKCDSMDSEQKRLVSDTISELLDTIYEKCYKK